MKIRQPLQALRGEIIGRSKDIEKQTLYYNKTALRKRANSKIKKSFLQFTRLRNQGINLSPFLEIGSERCERSMLLATKFNAIGFAADLSYHSLDFAAIYSKVLGMKTPTRICCDVHNLPFKRGSFSLVFSYAMLHHFLDPTPVIKEVARVLNSGAFFFDEEPVKHYLKLPIKTPHTPNKRWVFYLFSHFLSRTYPRKKKYGNIENDDISISDWNRIMSSFDCRELALYIPGLRSRFRSTNPASVFERILVSKLDSNRFDLKTTLVSFLGATITGLCYGNNFGNNSSPSKSLNLLDLLACPNCLEVNQAVCNPLSCEVDCEKLCKNGAIEIKSGKVKIIREKCNLCLNCLHNCPSNAIVKPKLFRSQKGFVCRNCGKFFPIINDVLILFSEEQGKNAYPKLLTRAT